MKSNFSIFDYEFINRAKELGREHLKFVFTVSKAISLGAGTIVFFSIFVDFINSNIMFSQLLLLIIFGIVSCLGVVVTYDGAMFGTLFLYLFPRKIETIATFLLIGVEFLLFSIIKPEIILRIDESAIISSIPITNYWYIVFCLFALISNVIIRSAMGSINVDGYETDELKNVVMKYKNRMKYEIKNSQLMGLFSFIFFLVLCCGQTWKYIIYINIAFAVILLVGLLLAFNDQHKQRLEIEEWLNSRR